VPRDTRPYTPTFAKPNLLHRQVLVRPVVRSSLVTGNLQAPSQIRSNNGDAVREPSDRLEELLREEQSVSANKQSLSLENIPIPPIYILPPSRQEQEQTHPKQHEYPKQLHPEPNQRPLHQDEQHARPKRQRALPLLLAREEDKRPLRAEQQRDADQEEDVAHGQQGAVEEEDQAEQEEEAAAAAEGDADFCEGRGWVSIA
jgi:hypothetical protein